MTPSHINKLPLGPNPLSNSAPGMDRLDYWICHLQPHVLTFAFLSSLICWLTGTLHLLVLIPIWSSYVWMNFEVDEEFVMGTDDRQTVYVVAIMNPRYLAVCEGVGRIKGMCFGVYERMRAARCEEEMGYFRIGF